MHINLVLFWDEVDVGRSIRRGPLEGAEPVGAGAGAEPERGGAAGAAVGQGPDAGGRAGQGEGRGRHGAVRQGESIF